jgi:hypothetical protein
MLFEGHHQRKGLTYVYPHDPNKLHWFRVRVYDTGE